MSRSWKRAVVGEDPARHDVGDRPALPYAKFFVVQFTAETDAWRGTPEAVSNTCIASLLGDEPVKRAERREGRPRVRRR